jgi:hypothetical protein
MTSTLDDYDCNDHTLRGVFPNARRFRTSGHNDRPIYDCVDAETLEGLVDELRRMHERTITDRTRDCAVRDHD